MYIKSVSFSLSCSMSNTFMLRFIEERNTYEFVATQSEYMNYYPYVIRFLTQTNIHIFIPIAILKRKPKITPEQLIGVVYGSVSVFFLALGIAILAIRKRMNLNMDISDDYLYDESSMSVEQSENIENSKNFESSASYEPKI